ncbi:MULTISPECIES: S-methyl-5-thioribose kinase [Clostridia]|uniref:S-methyl-5-thioribose kinase n=1 Tax=Clostridia TaxID=186801 RepID=UPI002570DFCD|nr:MULTISPECIES: S-methyl-5-thioribose kinase [Clostridia]
MSKFTQHFLMSHRDVKEFVTEELELFSKHAKLTVSEIGDGNINYVFQVVDETSGKSVVVKQADVLLRSSGRPLDISRNKIEADILKIQYDLVPEFIPEIFNYHETMSALTMEDISAFKNLRYELMEEQIFPNFAEEISTFLAKALLPTTDLCWDRHEKKELVKNFTNVDMCDISEDLVFTEPYYNYKGQNIIIEANQQFVEEHIYQNDALVSHVATLRNKYMNNAQALVHGDLHSGSIFINQEGIKVIDPEFAFYGPMGYDIGNVIGNLFFPLARAHYYNGDKQFQAWLELTIAEVYDQVKDKLVAVYNERVTLPLYTKAIFKASYLAEVMADSLGYAGTEIIRRVIGDSKVKEVSEAPLGEERIAMERALLKMGIELITQRKEIVTGTELVRRFNMIMA